MLSKRQIIKSIVQLTGNIEENYPELYRNLTEAPIAFSYDNFGASMSDKELEAYLDNLKQQLLHYVTSHKSISTVTHEDI